MVLIDDGRDFVFLVLKFIQLSFTQSSINELNLSLLICMVLFISFNNEEWKILLIVGMPYNVFVAIKVALFVHVVIKISS